MRRDCRGFVDGERGERGRRAAARVADFAVVGAGVGGDGGGDRIGRAAGASDRCAVLTPLVRDRRGAGRGAGERRGAAAARGGVGGLHADRGGLVDGKRGEGGRRATAGVADFAVVGAGISGDGGGDVERRAVGAGDRRAVLAPLVADRRGAGCGDRERRGVAAARGGV